MSAAPAHEVPGGLCESCRRRPAVVTVAVQDADPFAVCRECLPVPAVAAVEVEADRDDVVGAAPTVPGWLAARGRTVRWGRTRLAEYVPVPGVESEPLPVEFAGSIRLPVRLADLLWPVGVLTVVGAAAEVGWLAGGVPGLFGAGAVATVAGLAADHRWGPR